MKQIAAYHCDHCKRITVTPRAMKSHELQCIHNPEQRTCCTCKWDYKHEGCMAGVRLEAVTLRRHCPEWAASEGYAE